MQLLRCNDVAVHKFERKESDCAGSANSRIILQYAKKYPYTWKRGDNFSLGCDIIMGKLLISLEAPGNYAQFNT